MAFFEGLGKKISQTGQDAAQKARNLAETVKLNSLISDEEKRIKNVQMQIGKLYFETRGENPEPDFAQFIADINNANAAIQQYEEQVKQIKGITTCEKCGSDVAYNTSFCSSCGAQMNTQQPNNEPGGNTCANCNVLLEPGQLFCTGCGTKSEPPAAGCSACGHEIAEGNVFCLNCGTKL